MGESLMELAALASARQDPRDFGILATQAASLPNLVICLQRCPRHVYRCSKMVPARCIALVVALVVGADAAASLIDSTIS